MCTEVKVKINNNMDYKTKAKRIRIPKTDVQHGKMKGENENTVRQYHLHIITPSW